MKNLANQFINANAVSMPGGDGKIMFVTDVQRLVDVLGEKASSGEVNAALLEENAKLKEHVLMLEDNLKHIANQKKCFIQLPLKGGGAILVRPHDVESIRETKEEGVVVYLNNGITHLLDEKKCKVEALNDDITRMTV